MYATYKSLHLRLLAWAAVLFSSNGLCASINARASSLFQHRRIYKAAEASRLWETADATKDWEVGIDCDSDDDDDDQGDTKIEGEANRADGPTRHCRIYLFPCISANSCLPETSKCLPSLVVLATSVATLATTPRSAPLLSVSATTVCHILPQFPHALANLFSHLQASSLATSPTAALFLAPPRPSSATTARVLVMSRPTALPSV